MTTPGIPNDYSLSTTCFGTRLPTIQDQIFAAVGMGFRRIELGLCESPPSMEGLEDSKRETAVQIPSMMAGCRDPMNGAMAVERLGSLKREEYERGLNSIRRHVRLAQSWGCNLVVVRGNKVEIPSLVSEAAALIEERDEDGLESELKERFVSFVQRVQESSQEQVEQFCRSLHTLTSEMPDTIFAIEPGRDIDDLLSFEATRWVLEDLKKKNIQYWHDVGPIHLRQTLGLPHQGEWLDAFGSCMAGIHLQDAAANECEMPVGLGEVDFKLLKEYVPKNAERVVQIESTHGRAEILTSVRALVDMGF